MKKVHCAGRDSFAAQRLCRIRTYYDDGYRKASPSWVAAWQSQKATAQH